MESLSSQQIRHEMSQRASLARKAFFESLEGCPSHVRRVIAEGFSNRISRAHRRSLFGETAPELLSGLFQANVRMSPKRSRRFTAAWLDLYVAVLLADDSVDGQNTSISRDEALIAGMYLMSRAMIGLHEFLPRAGDVRPFDEVAEAALQELEQRRNPHATPMSSADHLAHKVALLKVCATALLFSDKEQVTRRDLMPIDRLAEGVQILDDLTDWEEDLRQGHMTPLLHEAAVFCKEQGHAWDHADRKQGVAALILSRSLENQLKRALRCLRIVDKQATGPETSAARRLLRSLIHEHTTFLNFAAHVRRVCESAVRSNKMHVALENAHVRSYVDQIDDRLTLVAQGS